MLDIDKIEKTPFFFIVANGRSGTTMLQQILDAHNEVMIPIESRLIIHLKKKYFKLKNWSYSVIDEFIDDLYRDLKFSKYWMVNRDNLTVKIKSIPENKRNFKLICKVIYLSYPTPFEKKEIKIIGDKNPIYCLFLNDLIEIFPDAKFIHLVRDYHASITSAIKTFGFKNIPVVSHGWVLYNKFIEEKSHEYPNNFLLLRYEDLVSSPTENVSKICSFLNIPFQEGMLDFNKTINQAVLPSITINAKQELNSIHPNLTKPINTNQIEKWRSELTTNQIITIEYISGDFAKKYGYTKDFPESKSIILWLKKIVGLIRIRINYFIITTYYKTPQNLRLLSTNFSAFAFKTLRFTHYFNRADFRNADKRTK